MKFQNKKAIISLVIGTLLLLNGCASTKTSLIKIEKDELDKLKHHPEITAIRYTPSPFRLATGRTTAASGVGVLFGPLGGALGAGATIKKMEAAGAEMVNEYFLQDPILSIKEYFLSNFTEQYEFNNVQSASEILKDDNIEALKSEYEQRVVIDFKTLNWALTFFPFDRSHYRVSVSARVRMINVDNSKIIWQGICKAIEDKTENSPTLDEVKSNNGELLKAKLIESAGRCSKDLISQLSDFK